MLSRALQRPLPRSALAGSPGSVSDAAVLAGRALRAGSAPASRGSTGIGKRLRVTEDARRDARPPDRIETMRRVGSYELGEELGRGGSGIVFRGRAQDGRPVALKLIHARPTEQRLAAFEREKRLLWSFGESQGFVPILDEGQEPPFLVMPLLEGGTLRDRLRQGALDVDEAVALVAKLAQALGRAHERGVVHRDMKPENVLFAADGSPLIADLGLAKHFRRDLAGATQSVSLSAGGDIGTPGYMAPEQLDGAKDVGPPADVFALGVILYRALTGERPF